MDVPACPEPPRMSSALLVFNQNFQVQNADGKKWVSFEIGVGKKDRNLVQNEVMS